MKNSAFTIVEFCDVPVSSFLQSSGVSETRPSFTFSADLLKVHSAPLSRLSKMLNGTGASITPWGKLFVAGLQLDSIALMLTF